MLLLTAATGRKFSSKLVILFGVNPHVRVNNSFSNSPGPFISIRNLSDFFFLIVIIFLHSETWSNFYFFEKLLYILILPESENKFEIQNL